MNIFWQHFTRIFSRLTESTILTAIRSGFVMTLPMVMVGALALIINYMPIPAYQEFMQSTFGDSWHNFAHLVYNTIMTIISVVICLSMCYTIAVKHNRKRSVARVNPLIASIVGFTCLTMVMQPTKGIMSISSPTGVSGIFVAILTSLLVSVLFINFNKIKFSKLHFFTDEADFSIPNMVSALVPAMFTIAVFATLQGIMLLLNLPDSYELTERLVRIPFEYIQDTKLVSIVYILIMQILWFFGLHGANILHSVSNDLYVTALSDNMAAITAGEPAVHVVTSTFLDVFVFTGGAGAAICAILATLIFSQRVSTTKIGHLSLIPSLFNISELIIYGLPILMNPFFVIPFIISPFIVGGVAYLFTALGVLPYTYTVVEWVTPPLINAYLATGSIAGVVVQVVAVAIGTMVYAPFVIAYDSSKNMHFKKVYKNLIKIAAERDPHGIAALLTREDEIGAASRALANDLYRAFEKQELYLEFQPQITIKTGKVSGVEALLRWKHESYGMIPPQLTVMIAEESHLVDNMGIWVIEEAVKYLAAWHAAGVTDVRMAANISVTQLANNDLPQKIADILKRYSIAPHELELEVTESIALSSNASMN
ncbi:MAG: EAL domain-containing protein, partial [Deferribacteraceae bacterium]|nr:EAL domain-containing protein [Deferribacteraceae bacterium]